MKIKIAVAALAVALGSSTAVAQPRWYGFGPSDYGNVPPYEATRLVRAYGMRPISSPVRMGRNYVVTAVDRHGQMRRVVVDARFGEVVRIVAVGRDAPRYGFRGGPDYYYDDDVVRPPRSLGGWRDTPPRPRARIPDDYDRLAPAPRPRPDGSVPQASIPADTGTVRPQEPGRIMEEEPTPPARAPDTVPDTAAAPPAVEASPGEPAAVQLPPPPRAERTAAPAPTPRARPQGENRRAATTPAQPVPPKPVPAERKPPDPQNQTASPRVILPGGPAPRTESTEAARPNSDKPSAAAAPPVAPSSALPPVNTLE